MLNEYDITELVYTNVSAFLNAKISGKTYHRGCRPTDSKKEDAEIVFSAADTNQIQKGFVYINIYIKDVDNDSGRKVENRKRIKQIIPLDKDIVELLNKEKHYRWKLDEATRVIEEIDTAEHFVSVKLRFKYLNTK